ncbi:glycosyltransferase [Francisellaceae bacterium]|nr:glycosyltransferase [Francisellaceae bacterium]
MLNVITLKNIKFTNMSELVSVIMPNYNGAKFLADAIRSVQAQTYSNWELLIVDDYSDDQSVCIINTLMKTDDKIKLFIQPSNTGQSAARNKAIKKATGRYIAFLDSDDLWLPNKLEHQLTYMRQIQACFCYTGYLRITENNQIIYNIPAKPQITYKQLLKQNLIGCLTVIYDTKQIGKVYFLESGFFMHEDYHLWLQILKIKKYSHGLNETLAQYREHNNCNTSVSGNKIKASLSNWKLYRNLEKLPLYSAVYYYCCFVITSLAKYAKIKFYKWKFQSGKNKSKNINY